jgi:hypothetical protein
MLIVLSRSLAHTSARERMAQMRHFGHVSAVVVVLGAALVGGPGPARAMGPVTPPGDIPDTQVFVTFRSTTGGYALEVPEGWARTVRGTDVRFVNALDGLQVTVTRAAAAPATGSARGDVATVQKWGQAVHVTGVMTIHLPGGPATLVQYASISEPDAVTGKRVRLEGQAYVFHKDTTLAKLSLWAPLGADNGDQWQRIARSFRWI